VTPFLRKILGLNWLLMAIMLALAIFGVIAIYSATYMREDPVAAEFWRKQANWVAVGFFAFIIVSLIDYRWVRWGALPMYLAGLGFLILTRFMGHKVYGARSWLSIAGVNFQPAQLAVIAGIMVLSLFLSQFRQMHPMLRLILCGAVVGAPCLLILMQPDLGECLIWGPVLMALLFVGGIPVRYLICIFLIVIAFIPIASHTNRNELLRSLIPTSIARVQRGRLINRLSPSARAGGPEKDSKRPIRRSSWVFFRLPRCTTITFSPLSASNGDLSEECFCSAALAYSYLSVCLLPFAPVINLDSYWSSVSPLSFLPTFFRTSE
jgi:rod shape determining protein RodA